MSAVAEPATAALSVEQVWRRYPGVVALSDVSIHVDPGEAIGVVGHNGAGKSTLMRILSGVERPDAGTIRIAGEPTQFGSPEDALTSGIALVPQQLNVVPRLTVAQNITLGLKRSEARAMVGGGFDLSSAERLLGDRMREIARELGIEDQLRRPTGTTRPSTQRMLMIARAMLRSPSVLLLDEPTAALHAAEVDRVFAAVERLQERGMAIMFITHRLEEVLRLTSRVVVLRQGEVVEAAPTEGLDKEQLGEMIAGQELEAAPAPQAGHATEVVIACDGLVKLPRVREVSFSVRKGEILGLAGLNGAGRSTILRTIAGLESPDAGTVRVDGRPVGGTRRSSIRAGVAYLPEDRVHNGVIPEMTVAASVTLADDRRFRVHPLIPLLRSRREAAEVDRIMARLDARPRGAARRKMRHLSGGNQQKALMARAMLSEARVFLFDEPTEGVDVAARAELHDQIRALAAGGTAVIVASSEVDEIVELASRVLVVSEGRIAREFSGGEISEVAVTRACVTA